MTNEKAIKIDVSYDDGIKTELVHNMDNATKSFLRVRNYFSKRNINIYNATRGGKLEIFPRVDLDNFFREYNMR